MKPCKLWGGYINPGGYGAYANHSILAHRVAYCEANGLALDDIRGLQVRHKCDVRACVEPSHLELGTHFDNMRDMRERKRSNRGERHGHAKLTDAQADAIRRRAPEGYAALATEFGVTADHVRRIIKGERRQPGTHSLSH